ncbi:mortality factor 4-like protein 1 [Antechinus flavipes]|uniref:mortality factor 4-like protein 1 n=1 Tax=Antechinus flavipes TaxID=38775 RepID=UPI0022363CE4|nr:mortality factor 4-like protein 1 [Antechinus flavipes]
MAPKAVRPKPCFQEGERVLCFHGPLLYEARCVRVAAEERAPIYLIHYMGWNKKWDEWVSESRILEYSPANVRRQRELQKVQAQAQANAKGRGAVGGGRKAATPEKKAGGSQRKAAGSQRKAAGPERKATRSEKKAVIVERKAAVSEKKAVASERKAVVAGRKAPSQGRRAAVTEKAAVPERRGSGTARKVARAKEAEQPVSSQGGGSPRAGPATLPPRAKRSRTRREAAASKAEVKVQIPEELKPWLVEDWDLVTKQKKLFLLPARHSVDSILQEYAGLDKWRCRAGVPAPALTVDDAVAGIKDYFNVLLGTQLLYDFERPQFAHVQAAHPEAPLSRVYGAPHLLRLFVPLGAVLACAPLEPPSRTLLMGYLHDFLEYLAENSAALFNASEYETAPPEYRQKAL